jgi:hypothetical protein
MSRPREKHIKFVSLMIANPHDVYAISGSFGFVPDQEDCASQPCKSISLP